VSGIWGPSGQPTDSKPLGKQGTPNRASENRLRHH